MDERQLWCAVIGLALEDATVNSSAAGDSTVSRSRRQEEARNWLTRPSRDFNEVCHLAGLDPVAVRERTVRLLEQHDAVPTVRRADQLLEFEGEARTMRGWCEHLGMTWHKLNSRLVSGWSIGEALTAPAGTRVRTSPKVKEGA